MQSGTYDNYSNKILHDILVRRNRGGNMKKETKQKLDKLFAKRKLYVQFEAELAEEIENQLKEKYSFFQKLFLSFMKSDKSNKYKEKEFDKIYYGIIWYVSEKKFYEYECEKLIEELKI